MLVIIEYVPYGDLLGYLRRSRGLNDTYFKDPDVKPRTSLTSQQLMKFSWHVAEGMRYLSSKNVSFNFFRRNLHNKVFLNAACIMLNKWYFNNPDVMPQTSLSSQQLMKFSWHVAEGVRYLSSKNVSFNCFRRNRHNKVFLNDACIMTRVLWRVYYAKQIAMNCGTSEISSMRFQLTRIRVDVAATRIRIFLKPHSLLHKSTFRPHETSKSGHWNRIILKPLSRVWDPFHTNPDKKYAVD